MLKYSTYVRGTSPKAEPCRDCGEGDSWGGGKNYRRDEKCYSERRPTYAEFLNRPCPNEFLKSVFLQRSSNKHDRNLSDRYIPWELRPTVGLGTAPPSASELQRPTVDMGSNSSATSNASPGTSTASNASPGDYATSNASPGDYARLAGGHRHNSSTSRPAPENGE